MMQMTQPAGRHGSNSAAKQVLQRWKMRRLKRKFQLLSEAGSLCVRLLLTGAQKRFELT